MDGLHHFQHAAAFLLLQPRRLAPSQFFLSSAATTGNAISSQDNAAKTLALNFSWCLISVLSLHVLWIDKALSYEVIKRKSWQMTVALLCKRDEGCRLLSSSEYLHSLCYMAQFACGLWFFMAKNCLCFSASFPQPNCNLGNGLLVLLEAIKGSRNLTKRLLKLLPILCVCFKLLIWQASCCPSLSAGQEEILPTRFTDRCGRGMGLVSVRQLSHFTSGLLTSASADEAWIW